jgi:hypothetical protein
VLRFVGGEAVWLKDGLEDGKVWDLVNSGEP